MAIEQDILDNLQGVDDVTTTQDDDVDTSTTQQEDASQQQRTADSTSSTTQQRETQSQQQQRTATTEESSTQDSSQRTEATRFRTKLTYNATNDVIDPSNGRVLARAGRERQYYEGFVNMRDSVQVMREQNTQLHAQLQSMQVLNDMPKQLGLSLGEVESAMRLMQSMKQSPAETVKHLIAQARASGIDLGDAMPSQIDMQAIRAMLDERLAPMQQREAQLSEQQHAIQAIQLQIAEFYSQHADAHVHEDLLAELITQTGDSLETAYWKLREYAARNALDFSQPLREQVLHRSTASQQSVTTQPATRQQTATRVNNGTSLVQQPFLANTEDQLASASSSWSDIVRNAMRANGMNI